MKFPILPLLCLPLLSSCLLHSKIYRLGYEYEGVSLAEENAYYRIKGKDYVKGYRTRLSVHSDSLWFDPCKGVYYRPVDGTQKDIVYHEIKREKHAAYPRGEWMSQDAATGAEKQTLNVPLRSIPAHYPTSHKPIYKPWALLTTPAAVATAVCIDIPVTLLCFTVGGACELGILMTGQQQQALPEKKSSPGAPTPATN